ncbi:hypothetical protein ACN23B_09485 [Anabaena sp. FACHB-709]|uniref:Uncharacterized protein n=2 Tax=Nostocaceae TaxID=1162 RepID=A0A1Z4KEU8_ANAVA|nr:MULTISPECIES: hypothetical protein [Nostocaceae]BAY67518.1 hypothetical protein NIES23_02920 [Trichormus variabilis NIES-23]MBD2174628.1 hypothetical protein [Anabaena cylindrica FACHB-318]MBD2266389.1 hypothetical protein [Anabaena sp. FACHB-709]MBD2275801.1 hypothetical protein [Nostoc sp. PCC 7120 = FACHB-418]MBD2285592.1 hypothetical protein [Anabaena cylindrica FACHB-170]
MSYPLPTETQSQPLSDFELNLLKEEYFFLQNTIEDYNKQIWVIKALGITGTGGVLTLMLQQRPNATAIALIGCTIPLFFWILESQWKHFQRGFYPRVYEIEYILTNTYSFKTPGIYSSWSHTHKRTNNPKRQGYLWDGLLNRSVFISYVLEIAFLLFMAAIAPIIWK